MADVRGGGSDPLAVIEAFLKGTVNATRAPHPDSVVEAFAALAVVRGRLAETEARLAKADRLATAAAQHLDTGRGDLDGSLAAYVREGEGAVLGSDPPCSASPSPTEAESDGLDRPVDAVALARLFHETYEELAPIFGYETRKESAVPWEDVPRDNRQLMIAVATVVLNHIRDERPMYGPEGRWRALRVERDTARGTLERIVENAEAWHGPLIGTGHERSLAVISGWAREALAAVGGTAA